VDLLTLVVFLAVYIGMILGRFPGLALDRTGIALLGAVALVAMGRVRPEEAWLAVDAPTISLLLGLMLLSAQFRLGGFYTRVTERISDAPLRPTALLGLLVATVGALSALLANDIVCLAMAPILAEGCIRRRLNPIPFLLALACAANTGSAATLIGNPQNMLIGQELKLSFAGYLAQAIVPAVCGLGLVWAIIAWQWRDRWEGIYELPKPDHQPFNTWQTGKGLVILGLLMAVMLFSNFPRDIAAMFAGALLLVSRKTTTGAMLDQVDWRLLVLFAGLFVVNHAFESSGWLAAMMGNFAARGVDITHPASLFGITALLSNLVSNVPAVMLLLPAATHPMSGAILALSSTLAGNLFIVGSIANIIVVDQAARLGITIDWKLHARTGIPVTLATLAIAGLWLWIIS